MCVRRLHRVSAVWFGCCDWRCGGAVGVLGTRRLRWDHDASHHVSFEYEVLNISLNGSLTAFTHSLTHSLTQRLTHSPSHSFYSLTAALFGLCLSVCLCRLGLESKRADKGMQERLKDRVRTMKQVIDGIKSIKLFAWEERSCTDTQTHPSISITQTYTIAEREHLPPVAHNHPASFTELITTRRMEELLSIKNVRRLQRIGVVLGRSSPIFATATVFVVRTAQGPSHSYHHRGF